VAPTEIVALALRLRRARHKILDSANTKRRITQLTPSFNVAVFVERGLSPFEIITCDP
jgi:hypothetical protein